jgi:glycosyltransferase involved in cell wall biosynthesis
MNILFVTTYFMPDSGAAAVRLTRLTKQFAARGHQVTVLTTMPHYPKGEIAADYRGKFTVSETQDGVRVVRTWLFATPKPNIGLRLLSQNSFMLTALLRGVWLPRPDVVLVEAQPVFTSLAGMLLAWLKHTPYVLNISDLWPEYLLVAGVMRETHPLYRVFKGLVNLNQRYADGIIGLYPSILDSVRTRIGDGKNRHVIYNAVDLARFHPNVDDTAFRAKYHLTPSAKLIVFIGAFVVQVDFETMFTAIERVDFARHPDAQIVLIGTGVQREIVSAWVATQPTERVRWLGWINHDEMPQAWAAASMAFWAIRPHNLYRTTIQAKTYEAMAAGVPIVAAVEGLTTTLIERSGAGITVPFGDGSALAAAIERLLDDQALRAQMSAHGRVYAEAHFDPERVANAYEVVLKQAISPSAVSAPLI